MMNRTPPPIPADRLELIRATVRERRDLGLRLTDAETQVKNLKSQIQNVEMEVLPDLFAEAGMRGFTLEAEGNNPPYTAKLEPFYHANIAANWPPDRRAAAFDWLIQNNAGDLIKNTITIELPRGANTNAITQFLKANNIGYSVAMTVAWNTLTSYIKELVERHKVLPPLDILGATIGRIVKLKANKDE